MKKNEELSLVFRPYASEMHLLRFCIPELAIIWRAGLASAVFLLDPIFYRTNPVFLRNQFSSAFCSSRYLSFTQRPDP